MDEAIQKPNLKKTTGVRLGDGSFVFEKGFFDIIQIFEDQRREEIEKQFGEVVVDFKRSRDSRIIMINRSSTDSRSSTATNSGSYSI